MTLATCLFRLTIFAVQQHFKQHFYDWGKQVDVVIHFCDGMCFTLSGSKSVKVYIYI
jgi:hypothetical protein